MKFSLKAISVFSFVFALLGSAQAYARTDSLVGVHNYAAEAEEDAAKEDAAQDGKTENRTTASVASDDSRKSDANSDTTNDGNDGKQDMQRTAGRGQSNGSRFR